MNVEIHDVRLSSRSKKQIRAWEKFRKSKGYESPSLSGDVVYSIECGNWYGPTNVTTHEFVDLKKEWEDAFHTFFGIPNTVLVEIDCFETGILSFLKGHPKYHKR